MIDLKNALPLSLGLAALLDLVVFLWVMVAAQRRTGERTPALPPSAYGEMAAVAAVPVIMLGTASLLAFPVPKGPWVAGSIVAGGVILSLLSAASVLLERATLQESVLGRLALAFLLLAGFTSWTGLDHDQAVNVALGFLLGMGSVAGAVAFQAYKGVVAVLAATRTGLGVVLGGTACLAAAVAWGASTLPDHRVGVGLPHLIASVLLLTALAVSILLPSPADRWGRMVKAAACLVLGGGVALLLLQFFYRVPLTWLAPLAMGLLLPLLWAGISPESSEIVGRSEDRTSEGGPLSSDVRRPTPDVFPSGLDLPWMGLVYILSGGGAVLLANRLGGAYGVALCGIALLVAAPARRYGWGWLEALLAVLAARSLIQLYLERTYLTHYGVNLTHAYAFAALALGLGFPLAVAVAQSLWRSRLWLAAWALALLLHTPLLLGFFLHIEPVAAFQEGIMAAVLLLGFLAGLPEGLLPEWLSGTVNALPALLVGTTVVALLSAPWAIQVANTERLLRLELFVMLGAATLLLAWLGNRQAT